MIKNGDHGLEAIEQTPKRLGVISYSIRIVASRFSWTQSPPKTHSVARLMFRLVLWEDIQIGGYIGMLFCPIFIAKVFVGLAESYVLGYVRYLH